MRKTRTSVEYEVEVDGQMTVIDQGDIRKYFHILPNLIDDLGLTPFAYRLYGHLKRVAGDRGRCKENTETLAAACNMAVATVSAAKKELVERNLISIERVPSGRGRPLDVITIEDIWLTNFSVQARIEEQARVGLVNLSEEEIDAIVARRQGKKGINSRGENNGSINSSGEQNPGINSRGEMIKEPSLKDSLKEKEPDSDESVGSAIPEKYKEEVEEMISLWTRLFPGRGFRRTPSLEALAVRRLKNKEFRDLWREAFTKAALNSALVSDPECDWWNLRNVLSSNEKVQKVVAGTYDWMNERWLKKGKANGNAVAPTTINGHKVYEFGGE